MAFSGLAVVGLSAYILKDVPKVKRSMGKLMDTAKSVVRRAAKPMAGPLAEMFTDLRGTVKDLEKPLRRTFKIVADSGLTKNIARGVDKMVKPMLDGFNTMLARSKPVFDAFEDLLEGIGLGLKGFFEGISFRSQDSATGLRDLGKVIQGLLTAIGYAFGFLAAKYVLIRNMVVRVVNMFRSMVNAVAGFSLPALASAVGDWFKRLGSRAVSLTRSAVSAVVRFFVSLPGRAAGALGALAGAIMGKINGARNRMLDAIRNAISRAVRFVASLPGRAGRALGSLAGAVGSRVRAAGNRMVNIARDKVTSAVNAVRRLPGRAKSALGSLGRVLYNAGASLISGFIDGIKAKIPSVSGVLGGLTSKLTSWKGPERLDKRILTPSGEWVMDGFVRGIERRIPAVRSALGGVTSDLPGMSASASVDSAVRVATPDPRTDRVVLDVTGTDEDMKRLIRRMVKFDGGGDVQSAFG